MVFTVGIMDGCTAWFVATISILMGIYLGVSNFFALINSVTMNVLGNVHSCSCVTVFLG